MEILQYWKIMRQRWVLILTITAVAVVTVGLVSFFVLKPEYEATATILVQSNTETQQSAYNDVMAGQKLVKTYSQILKSRQIADDVLKRLHLDLTSDQLLNKVSTSSASDSLVTTLTVTDSDPEQAVAIANGFSESFTDKINQIMKVDNVSILDHAKNTENATPVSPRPFLNMVIALVLGLMVGAGLAFFLEFLDNTVKREEEVEDFLGLPVLGVIAQINLEGGVKHQKRSEREFVGGVKHEA